MSDESVPTTVVVHFHAKAGHGAELRDHIVPAIPKLSDLEGCFGGSLYYDIDSPDLIVLIEHWVSVEAHKAYIHRIETDGTMDALNPLLDRPPQRRYLSKL
jgi:quinol monooxygenase YgiN